MSAISIIIPLHNKGAYIRETLCSLQKQTYADWEALVVENHSSDDGPAIVDRVASKDSRIRLIKAPEHVRGPGAARNYGLDHALGEWVLFFDADDLLLPEHLSSLLEVAKASDSDIVASDWLQFVDGAWQAVSVDALGNDALKILDRHHAVGSLVPQPRISVQDSSIAYAPWAVHCALVKKEVFKEERRWVVELDRVPSEDTAFWFRVLWKRDVTYTRQATALYRTETHNHRNTHQDLEKWAEAMEAIHAENVRFLGKQRNEVNSDQAECLMRVWSKIGVDGMRNGMDSLFVKSAFKLADLWACKGSNLNITSVACRMVGCEISEILGSKLRLIFSKKNWI